MSYMKEFLKGLVKENPTLVSLLGMCPTLAVTVSASNAVGMGAAATFVLICSNLVISLLKNFIPKQVRLPAYIVIIAGFVTVVGFIMQRYMSPIYDALGIFLPLITVNCIILGRAEMFASKNSPLASVCDGAGMGVGFTLAMLAVGSLREIFGCGTWFDIPLAPDFIEPMSIFIMPAGGFFVLGCVIALVNKISGKKPPAATGCAACPNREGCISCPSAAQAKEGDE